MRSLSGRGFVAGVVVGLAVRPIIQWREDVVRTRNMSFRLHELANACDGGAIKNRDEMMRLLTELGRGADDTMEYRMLEYMIEKNVAEMSCNDLGDRVPWGWLDSFFEQCEDLDCTVSIKEATNAFLFKKKVE